jgi:hypothetical protein
MAKMFYSLEEAAERLGKTPDEVHEMASRNEITEFRDGDKLIFKKDQIDLLTGDEDDAADADAGVSDEGMIPLVDSSEHSSLGLADSFGDASSASGAGSASGSGTAMEGTGISVFDADDLEEADPGAATMVTEESLDSVSLESFGSGSGLMDLTRESDDTSLGADGLLDELYGADEGPDAVGDIGESGLFEGASSSGTLVDEGEGAPAAAVVAAESVDPKWSGLVGGLSVGMLAAAGLGLAMVLMATVGAVPDQVGSMFGGNVLIWIAAMLGVTLVLGGVGFFVGSRR